MRSFASAGLGVLAMCGMTAAQLGVAPSGVAVEMCSAATILEVITGFQTVGGAAAGAIGTAFATYSADGDVAALQGTLATQIPLLPQLWAALGCAQSAGVISEDEAAGTFSDVASQLRPAQELLTPLGIDMGIPPDSHFYNAGDTAGDLRMGDAMCFMYMPDSAKDDLHCYFDANNFGDRTSLYDFYRMYTPPSTCTNVGGLGPLDQGWSCAGTACPADLADQMVAVTGLDLATTQACLTAASTSEVSCSCFDGLTAANADSLLACNMGEGGNYFGASPL
jgi:hypothetical protein